MDEETLLIGMEIQEGARFYTENGINVTKRILMGTTKAFTKIKTAKEFAAKNKRYAYQLFISKPTADGYEAGEMPHFGYAVPN